MNKKISFDVEGISVIDERNDSQFAILEIDAFASGKNRHNMYVSRDTLEKTAKTILSKPVTWIYDKFFDDIGSHDEMQVPGGFVPSDSPLRFKELEDGRVMLTVLARIWKRYSGDLLSFFKRDGGEKGVSVEMEVYDAREFPDGSVELLDFCYSAITCLGDMVTPAIPWAKATVMRFSDDYRKDFLTEFSSKYSEIDFAIPDSVKKNSMLAMDFHRKYGTGNSVAIYNGNYFIEKTNIDIENAKSIYAYLGKFSKIHFSDKNPRDSKYVNFMLSGGFEALEWLKNIVEKVDEINRQSFYKNEKENIIMEDEEKELKEEEKEVFQEQSPEEKAEEKEEEKAEEKEESEEEPKEESKKEFSLDEYIDVTAALAFLESETEDNMEIARMACDEMKKGQMADSGKIIQGMYAVMTRYAEKAKEFKQKFEEADEKARAYMAENEDLKKFKAEVEEKSFQFEVESTMKEIENAVNMPREEFESLVEQSKEFSLENIDMWKNIVKAKAFSYTRKSEVEEKVVKYGLPFGGKKPQTQRSLWD